MALIGEEGGGNPTPTPENPVVTIFTLGDGWVIILADDAVFTTTNFSSIGSTTVVPQPWEGPLPLPLPGLDIRGKGGEISFAHVAALVVADA